MENAKITFNVEVTTQPKQYHSLKVGVTVHECNIDYEDDNDLAKKSLAIQKKYQSILNRAKNLAIEKKLYSGQVERLYDEKLKADVTIQVGDQNDEEKADFLEESNNSNGIDDVIDVNSSDISIDELEDIEL